MTSAKSELLLWGFKKGIFPAAADSILTEAAASALANIQGELQWRRANLYPKSEDGGESSCARDKRRSLVLQLAVCSAASQMGCGLPCAGPAVWGGEVVPVGTDLI